MPTTVKGRSTFRFAAACFGFSAVWEMLNLQDEALLFGHAFGGAIAVTYHVVYAALFTWLLLGLWYGSRSGYYALFVTTLIYTLDRLQMLFVGDAMAAMLRKQVAGHPEVLQIISADEILRAINLSTFAFLACWWGFMAYAYYRRDYFWAFVPLPASRSRKKGNLTRT